MEYFKVKRRVYIMDSYNILNRINSIISHYDDEKYWKYKGLLSDNKTSIIRRMLCLYYMKKCEAYNCASLGNRIDGGSCFKSPPTLPHGIKGIFISDKSVIGENATIYQQVTIGVNQPNGGAPVIGNHVFIGAGAKIIG